MKNCIVLPNQTTRRILPSACATALAVAFAVSLPAHAGKLTPPDVPPNLRDGLTGNRAFLKGEAQGTQNYVCVPSASSPTGVAFALFTPEATLFSEDDGGQIITHFFSPNPDPRDPNTNPAVVAAGGAIRATWVHSRDNSSVWAKVHQPIGAVNVDRNAIDWLLLDVVGAEPGFTGGGFLTKTTFIHRVNTTGGRAPSTGCASPTDVGNQAFVPYTADYFFYFNPKADQ